MIGVNKGAKRQSVEEVIDMFKRGNRDLHDAYRKIKETEKEIPDIVASLEQLTDILCQVTYFNKAFDLLKIALEDIKGNPILFELIARVCFIMEMFDKSVYYNKKAAELQPDNCFHNWSDMGLGYYRLGL